MNATEQFIYLTACASAKRQASLETADFDKLWQMAQGHNLTALVAKALQGTEAFRAAGMQEQKRWNSVLDNNIKKTMLFEAERRAIEGYFEQNGIWYMPLKGVIINPLFPHFGTREFADYDILMDPSRMADGKAFMFKRGYTFRTDSYPADEYSKPSFFNIELHREMIDHSPQFERFYQYYANVKERLIKDKGNGFGYHFSDDDFYIFFIVHAFKHYDNRGTGFRTVADEYVLLHTDKLHIDFAAVTRELEKLGIADFEYKLRSLADAVFENPEQTEDNLRALSPELREMLRFILSCGTFGSMENLFSKEFEESAGSSHSKAKYYLKRVFPERKRFKYSNPFVYKHKAVYPFFLMYRMAVRPIKNRRELRKEIKTIKHIK